MILGNNDVEARPNSVEVDGVSHEYIVPLTIGNGRQFSQENIGSDFFEFPPDGGNGFLSSAQVWAKRRETGFMLLHVRHCSKKSVPLFIGLSSRPLAGRLSRSSSGAQSASLLVLDPETLSSLRS